MSARQDIVNALVAKFKLIDGTGTYKTNVFSNVLPRNQWWNECNDFPAIRVVGGTEEREYHPAQFKWGHFNISIKAYVKQEDPLDELEDLISDIESVIDESYRLDYGLNPGQQTADIIIDNIITDEGLLAPYGIAEINIKVKYQVL